MDGFDGARQFWFQAHMVFFGGDGNGIQGFGPFHDIRYLRAGIRVMIGEYQTVHDLGAEGAEGGEKFLRPGDAGEGHDALAGKALGIGIGDRVNILQYATYSVISPESCSSILWRDPEHAEEAAEALKLTSVDLREMGLVDEIIPEPEGGAHNDPEAMASTLGATLERQLDELLGVDAEVLLEKRYSKFRGIGVLAGLEE